VCRPLPLLCRLCRRHGHRKDQDGSPQLFHLNMETSKPQVYGTCWFGSMQLVVFDLCT
jgi:hypothetical protein